MHKMARLPFSKLIVKTATLSKGKIQYIYAKDFSSFVLGMAKIKADSSLSASNHPMILSIAMNNINLQNFQIPSQANMITYKNVHISK